jgi:Peptidase inhibitor family I36
MRIRRSIAATVGTLALAAGGIATAATANASDPAPAAGQARSTASAALLRAQETCPSGNLCVYSQPNWTGRMAKTSGNSKFLGLSDHTWNHPKSAYNNGRTCSVTVYTGYDQHGRHYTLNRGTGWRQIGSNLPDIHSVLWC